MENYRIIVLFSYMPSFNGLQGGLSNFNDPSCADAPSLKAFPSQYAQAALVTEFLCQKAVLRVKKDGEAQEDGRSCRRRSRR